MLNRLIASETPRSSSRYSPASSGPRCLSSSFICESQDVSCFPAIPTIPHILLSYFTLGTSSPAESGIRLHSNFLRLLEAIERHQLRVEQHPCNLSTRTQSPLLLLSQRFLSCSLPECRRDKQNS